MFFNIGTMSNKRTAKETAVLGFRVPKPVAKQLKQAALDNDQKPAHLIAEIFVPAFEEYLRNKVKVIRA